MKLCYEHPEWEVEDIDYTDVVCSSLTGTEEDPGNEGGDLDW